MTVPLKAGVLVADDHAIVRRGVGQLLNAEADFEVIAQATLFLKTSNRKSVV